MDKLSIDSIIKRALDDYADIYHRCKLSEKEGVNDSAYEFMREALKVVKSEYSLEYYQNYYETKKDEIRRQNNRRL